MNEKELTSLENFYIGIIRYNQSNPIDYVYRWGVVLFRQIKIEIEQRSKKSLWGRFGGGWNWQLGFEVGRTSILIHYLVGTVRIKRLKRGEE